MSQQPALPDRRMPLAADVLVIRSQLVLFGSLAVCVALLPGFLFSRDMGGVSNYGVQQATVVPYTAGTLLAVWLMWRAASLLRALPRARTVVAVTRAACVCLLVNLLTTYPYKSGPTWATLHTWTAIALALVEFLGGWLVLRTVAQPVWRATVVTLLVVGFTCLVLTYTGRLHVLFVAEVMTAAGFGLALIAAARALSREPTDAVTPGQSVRRGTPPAGRFRRG